MLLAIMPSLFERIRRNDFTVYSVKQCTIERGWTCLRSCACGRVRAHVSVRDFYDTLRR